MQRAKILGIVGSPRKNGNSAKLVKKALEGARSVAGIDTELYEMAGKKFHHCTGCFKCGRKGECAFKDDMQDLARRYLQADGVIWGAPVYHMAVPGQMKCFLDRFVNSVLCNFMRRGKDLPRLSKVCGVLTVGGTRYGGQDLTLSFMVNSCLCSNGLVVAGDILTGSYIGAAAQAPAFTVEDLIKKDQVLEDEEGLMCMANLGKRVAEMTKIVKAGLSAVKDELPSEYSYSWEELEWS